MPRILDPKAVMADQLSQKLLMGHVRSDRGAVDRVTDHLIRENDPELLLMVLGRSLGVSCDILLALAGRVGANPARAVDDAFLPQ